MLKRDLAQGSLRRPAHKIRPKDLSKRPDPQILQRSFHQDHRRNFFQRNLARNRRSSIGSSEGFCLKMVCKHLVERPAVCSNYVHVSYGETFVVVKGLSAMIKVT